jgi:hypothetical protein
MRLWQKIDTLIRTLGLAVALRTDRHRYLARRQLINGCGLRAPGRLRYQPGLNLQTAVSHHDQKSSGSAGGPANIPWEPHIDVSFSAEHGIPVSDVSA